MISAKDIQEIIGGIIIGNPEATIKEVRPIDHAVKESVSFCSKHGSEAIAIIKSTEASVVICHSDIDRDSLKKEPATFVLVDNPRKSFILVMTKLFQERKAGISPLAYVEEGSAIDPSAYIGPFCYLGKSVTVGKNVIIQAGTVIGKEGFGFERNDDGTLIRFPHIGGVIIEDEVEIGANVCIDRGTLGNTVIGKGSKIDNLCHIAHNVQIGKHCMIIAQAMLAGSSQIGDYSTVAPCACVREKVKVGDNVLIGLGAIVTKDVDPGWIAFGTPAKPIRRNEKVYPPK